MAIKRCQGDDGQARAMGGDRCRRIMSDRHALHLSRHEGCPGLRRPSPSGIGRPRFAQQLVLLSVHGPTEHQLTPAIGRSRPSISIRRPVSTAEASLKGHPTLLAPDSIRRSLNLPRERWAYLNARQPVKHRTPSFQRSSATWASKAASGEFGQPSWGAAPQILFAESRARIDLAQCSSADALPR